MPNNNYVSKLTINNQTRLDLTDDTVTAENLMLGYTAHDRTGAPIIGTHEDAGGAEFNVAYGDTAPEDTSKLWIKGAEPDSVKFTPKVIGNEQISQIGGLGSRVIGSACACVGNKIFLLGSTLSDDNGSIRYFDLDTNQWYTSEVTFDSYYGMMSAEAVGNIIYLFGGYTAGPRYVGYIRKYNVLTNELTTLSSTISAGGKTATVRVGNKIYTLGGTTAYRTYNHDIYCFDAETEISTKLEIKSPGGGDRAVAAVGNKIYLFGGYPGTNPIHCIDVSNNTISQLTTVLPFNLVDAQAKAVGTNIYIFGGGKTTSSSDKNQKIVRFNTITEEVGVLSGEFPESVAIDDILSNAVKDNKIYIFAGTGNLYCFNVDMELASNHVLIQPEINENIFPLITDQMEIGIKNVYRGDSNGKGQLEKSYLYRRNKWRKVSGASNIVSVYKSTPNEIASGTELTTSIGCTVGDMVVATFAIRGTTYTISEGWTFLGISDAESSSNQRTGFAYKFAESTTESITITQDSAGRIYTNLVSLTGATGITFNGFMLEEGVTSVTAEKPDGLVLWGLSSNLWGTSSPYKLWEVSNNEDIRLIQLGTTTASRLLTALDQSNDANVTFTYVASTGTTNISYGSCTITGIPGFWYDTEDTEE